MTPTDQPTLKYCPFCCGEARNSSHHSCDCCGKAYTGIVQCIKCGSEVSHFDTDEQAIALWNTRPIEAALQTQIDRLTKERDDARRIASNWAGFKITWEDKTDE